MIFLEKEFEFFVKNQKEFVEKYRGKYIVIKNEKVLGAYNSLSEAVEETSKREKLGTFLVQKCEPTKKAYTQHYHSRVSFELK
jgi:hypothetical protein